MLTDSFTRAGISWNTSGGGNLPYSRGIAPVSKLVKNVTPASSEVNIVQALENDLRTEKKTQIKTEQSQILGGSGTVLPDVVDGNNIPLIKKANKYAPVDNVGPPTSVLADFSRLLNQQSPEQNQNAGLATGGLLAMSFSTMANTGPPAERIVESQLTYDLAAASFGLQTEEDKAMKKMKGGKFLNAQMY